MDNTQWKISLHNINAEITNVYLLMVIYIDDIETKIYLIGYHYSNQKKNLCK